MKLASMKNGRDGALVIVNLAGTHYISASAVCQTLREALDNWEHVLPALTELSKSIESDGLPLDTSNLMAPLPRAEAWLDGSAYVKHVELVRKARGAELPDSFWHDPLMYQGHSAFNAPTSPIPARAEEDGLDFEAEVAVIVDDVPEGVCVQDALSHVKLITLINDITLRGRTKSELAKGFGFVESKPPCTMSPFAITPDELGAHWKDGTITLPLVSTLNGQTFGRPMVSVDMTFNFAELIAHAAKTRPLGAGTVIGSGTIANVGADVGSSCIAEKRMLETITESSHKTPWLTSGDHICINMHDGAHNVFGDISQKVGE